MGDFGEPGGVFHLLLRMAHGSEEVPINRGSVDVTRLGPRDINFGPREDEPTVEDLVQHAKNILMKGLLFMHDAKGRELKVGDTIVIPCKITQCSGDENFCCLNAETVGVMPGNGSKNQINALSTKQVYRANAGDDVSDITTNERDGKTYLA